MSTRTLLSAVSCTIVVALAVAACSEEGTQAPESALTELEPDCLECLEALTECTSTTKNEMQFLGCRDLFQSCQEKMQLGPKECGRPSNQIACELCKDRKNHCESDDCDVEFSVCKTFLMSRDQERCTEDGGPEPGTCSTCVGALAQCGFSGESSEVCESTFSACKKANKLSEGDCSAPSVEASCAACLEEHAGCEAAGDPECGAGWSSCVATLANEGACGIGPNEETGEGGGGTGPEPSCSHDACEVGDAMSASCDGCIAELCELDPYCCESSYDETCVAEAQTIATCGCEPVVTCAHDECDTGEILDPTCSDCATAVCEADGYCCNTTWDELCVDQAVSLCQKTCE
jgi:hypothetical protein